MAGQRAGTGTVTAGFTARQTTAVMIVGVIGVLIAGLQPQLLGALAVEHRVSAGGLGLLATLELLAMGIAAGGAGFVLARGRLRTAAFVALAITALADCWTPFAPDAGLFVARGIAGLAEGVLVWIAIGLVVRSARPERWSGIYLALQTFAQLVVATILGLVVVPAYGSAGGFVLMALITAAGVLALGWLPRTYAPLPAADASAGMLPVRAVIGLIGVALYLAFIVAIWVYVEPLGLQRGVAPAALALIVPVSLAMQVVGAATAALIAGRVSAGAMIAGSLLINLVLLAVMAAPPSTTAFVVATALFGFLWLFALPFQVPLVIAADPSRRSAMMISGAQLVGAAAGPLCASFLVSDSDVRPVLWLGAICAIVGVVALTGAAARARPTERTTSDDDDQSSLARTPQAGTSAGNL